MKYLLVLFLILDTSPRPRKFTAEHAGLLKTLSPHKTYAYGVAFSGSYLATGGADNKIHLIALGSWKKVRTLTGHTQNVWSVAFSPDGKTLISGALDGTARVWDVKTGRELFSVKHRNYIYGVAFSRDGTKIVTGGGDNMGRIWDAKTGAELATLTGHTSYLYSVAFSPNGKLVATAAYDGTARLWDAETGKQIRMLSPGVGALTSLAFSRNGRTLFVGGINRTIAVYDVETGRKKKMLTGHTGQIYGLAVTPNGRYLVSSGDFTVRLWDIGNLKAAAVLKHHTAQVYGVAASPDGRMIASASTDMQVKVWGYVPGGMKKVRAKGFFGVTVSDGGGGAEIQSVIPGTAAEKAGVRVGDVIISVGGVKTKNTGEAISQIGKNYKGDTIEIVILRGGTEIKMKVKLGDRPDNLDK